MFPYRIPTAVYTCGGVAPGNPLQIVNLLYTAYVESNRTLGESVQIKVPKTAPATLAGLAGDGSRDVGHCP